MDFDGYYGRGITFPMRLGPTGGVAQSMGVAKVEESIRIILGTQYGERLMRPKFGCNLKSLAFAPNDTATANLARYYVLDGLKTWEPRIEVLAVDVDTAAVDPGVMLIQIRYRLRASQDVQSLIYPFYLEPR